MVWRQNIPLLTNSYLVGKATRMERGIVDLLKNMFLGKMMDNEYRIKYERELYIYKELEMEVAWHQEVKVVLVMARGRELVEMVNLMNVDFRSTTQFLIQAKSQNRCTSQGCEGLFPMDWCN